MTTPTKPEPGMFFWLSDWPWFHELTGRISSHPGLVLSRVADTRWRIVAITHSADLLVDPIPLVRALVPSAFPPLDDRPPPSCLAFEELSGKERVSRVVSNADWSPGMFTVGNVKLTANLHPRPPQSELDALKRAIAVRYHRIIGF